MINIVRGLLLKIRNWPVLQRHCLAILARHNLQPDEILSYDFDGIHPRLSFKNGLTLCAFDDLRIGTVPEIGLPETHTGCLAAYLLRYRYPHSLPNLIINTGKVPRKIFPAIIHRQHLNTLHDLKGGAKEDFLDVMPVRQGDKILEIGAYMGFGTVHLSGIAGETGRVHSIEADSAAFEVLQKNVGYNSNNNVTLENFAVGGRDTDAAVFYKSGRQANSLHKDIIGECDQDTVRVKSLASVLHELDFNPTFMILTINGSELEALHSARDFLELTNNLRIIVPGWYRDSKGRLGERIISLLRETGFNVAYTNGMHIFAYK